MCFFTSKGHSGMIPDSGVRGVSGDVISSVSDDCDSAADSGRGLSVPALDVFLRDDLLPKDSKNCVALKANEPILAVFVPVESENKSIKTCMILKKKEVAESAIFFISYFGLVQTESISRLQIKGDQNDGVENIVGKEKMLVTSIFSFSHNVFKTLLLQGR